MTSTAHADKPIRIDHPTRKYVNTRETLKRSDKPKGYYKQKASRVLSHPDGRVIPIILLRSEWWVLDNVLEVYWGVTAGYLVHKADHEGWTGDYETFFQNFIRAAWHRHKELRAADWAGEKID